jgi:hypothetical protein
MTLFLCLKINRALMYDAFLVFEDQPSWTGVWCMTLTLCVSILLLVEINLNVVKNIQNLIINVNRTRSLKC